MTVQIGKVYKLTGEHAFNEAHTTNKKIIEFVNKHSSRTIKVTGLYNGNEPCVGEFVNGLGETYTGVSMRCKITASEIEKYFTELKSSVIDTSAANMMSLSKLIEIYKKHGGTKTNPTKNELIRAYTEYTKLIVAEEAELQKMQTELDERTAKLAEMKAMF